MKLLDWKVPWLLVGGFSYLSQQSRTNGIATCPPTPLYLSFRLELGQNETSGSAVGAGCSLPVLTALDQWDMHQPSP